MFKDFEAEEDDERLVTLSLDEKTWERITDMAKRDNSTTDEALCLLLGALVEYALVSGVMFVARECAGPDDTVH